MEEGVEGWVKNSEEIQQELKFLKDHDLYGRDVNCKLNIFRMEIDTKMKNKNATRYEVLWYIREETLLFNSCQNKVIEKQSDTDTVDLHSMDTRVIKNLSKRIIASYRYMLQKFTVNNDELFMFITFCNSNAHYYNAEQCEFLKEYTYDKSEVSLEVWLEMLKLYSNFELIDEMFNILKKGVHLFKEHSSILFAYMREHVKFKYPNKVEKLYLEAINVPYGEISLKFRCLYFIWYAEKNNIYAIRELYKVLYQLKPFCIDLVELMISYEFKNITDISKIRKVYEDAASDVGKDEISIWISYILFENTIGNHIYFMDKIYKEALCHLDPKLKSTMTKKFNELDLNFRGRVVTDEVIEIDSD